MAVRKVGFSPEVHQMPETAVESTPAVEAPKVLARKELGASSAGNALELSQKDLSFIAQASLKSTLESPMIANLSMEVGRDQVPALIREYTELGVQIVLDIMAKQK